jgi:putative transposase
MSMRRVGRLREFPYRGKFRYSLTTCTFNRITAFTERDTCDTVRAQLVTTAVAEQFDVIAYCLMPDHIHILAEGCGHTSDLRRFMSLFKQTSGFWYAKREHRRLWQAGFYDHILRDHDVTLVVAKYILENPVRAGLVSRFTEYPYCGSSRYTLEELAEGCSEGRRGGGL